jgi:hypothetical protein
MKRTVKAGESLRLAGRFHRGDEQSGRIIQTLREKTSYFFNTYLKQLDAEAQRHREKLRKSLRLCASALKGSSLA